MKLYEVYDSADVLLGTVLAKDAEHACERLAGVYAVPLVE